MGGVYSYVQSYMYTIIRVSNPYTCVQVDALRQGMLGAGKEDFGTRYCNR